MTLSILCITRAEPFALPFLRAMDTLATGLGAELVIGADGHDAYRRVEELGLLANVWAVQSDGYLESVLDTVLARCTGDYVLRLDDDERVSPAMMTWLAARRYERADHWAFPRANLWRDAQTYIVNAPLWPDLQTRLSVRSKAGGRTQIHAGSPYGTGEIAPVVLEHHKFLVKPLKEREAIAARYDAIAEGAGTGHTYGPYTLPERCFPRLGLAALGDGDQRSLNVNRLEWWVTL